MIKTWILSHTKVLAQLSKVVKWNKENQHIKPMYVERDKGGNVLSCVYFSKKCDVINSVPEFLSW